MESWLNGKASDCNSEANVLEPRCGGSNPPLSANQKSKPIVWMHLSISVNHMVIEADKFHLRVAKRLLSPLPISEQERASLLSEVANRESMHENMEAVLREMIKVLSD